MITSVIYQPMLEMRLITALKSTVRAVMRFIVGLLAGLPLRCIGALCNYSPKLDGLIDYLGKWQSLTVAELQAKINAGVDVNAWDKFGSTLLYDAAAIGNVEVLPVLIKAGADVNAATDLGLTPLHGAANNGKIESISVLIKAGADVNQADDFGTIPLHGAAHWRRVKVIPILINAGSDVNATDDNGTTPLHLAAVAGNAEVIPVLIKAGANVNATSNNDSTPLHWAALEGKAEVIPILVQAGANINSMTRFGETPLDWARAKKHWTAVKLLEDARHQQNRQRKKPSERHDEMPSDMAAARKFLELPADVKLTSEHIAFAFRRARQRHHPDRGGNTADFMRAKWAYEILKKEI